MKRIFIFILLSVYFKCFTQEKKTDSIWNTNLNELVITAQIEPQSLQKSTQNVKVITAEDIQNLAANNLADVLNQYINITVTPNSNSGKSTVSLFGLDANYFKILIDNIPLINENGFGNNTDLSQINLNEIERVEIIEGSMGVTHGANAVSGILNIITKKNSPSKWNINASVQEETVGNEYALFDEGRHIQNLKIAHQITTNWFASIGSNHNDFKGFLGNKNGKDYTVNNNTRGYTWLPRNQWQSNALVSYKNDSFRFFYKFEWLDELINYYDATTQSGYNSNLGAYKYGNDKRYFTDRFYHHLNVTGKIFSDIKYNVSFSHQYQKREIEDYRYNISYGSESANEKQKNQSMEVFYSTGTFHNFLKSNRIKLQIGYEAIKNNGFAIVDDEGNTTKIIRKDINNVDFFVASEISFSDNFSLRPGFRYSFQSDFNNQYATSLGSRFLFSNDFEWRMAIGQSYLTPTFEELYNDIIFDGHYFIGNENLVPETSISLETSIKKSTLLTNKLDLQNILSVNYLTVDDRITSALNGYDSGTPIYQYINISQYKSLNIACTNSLQTDNWKFHLGASVTGISQLINNLEFTSDDKFLYNLNLNSNVSYTVLKWNTTFSTYYKLTGKTQQLIAGDNSYVLSELESYNWLDFSIRKNFYNNKLQATLGARNLLNINSINQTNMNESGGHEVSSQLLLAYGRSYFFKLTYNFNI